MNRSWIMSCILILAAVALLASWGEAQDRFRRPSGVRTGGVQIYATITVNGSTLPGSAGPEGNQLQLIDAGFSVEKPRHPGSYAYSPFEFTTPSSVSPLLLKAHVLNEPVQAVIEYWTTSASGEMQLLESITLESGRISSFSQHGDRSDTSPLTDHVAIAFLSIRIEEQSTAQPFTGRSWTDDRFSRRS